MARLRGDCTAIEEPGEVSLRKRHLAPAAVGRRTAEPRQDMFERGTRGQLDVSQARTDLFAVLDAADLGCAAEARQFEQRRRVARRGNARPIADHVVGRRGGAELRLRIDADIDSVECEIEPGRRVGRAYVESDAHVADARPAGRGGSERQAGGLRQHHARIPSRCDDARFTAEPFLARDASPRERRATLPVQLKSAAAR